MITKRKAPAAARGIRLLRLLTATGLVAALAALPMRSAAAPTTPGGTEYVDAVANSSLVHIRVVWKGWLVVPRQLSLWGGYYQAKGTYGPFTAVVTCSGFVASPTGQVVTAGHCVDANSYIGGKGAVLASAMAGWHDASGNLLTASAQARLGQILQMNADIEGIDSGSPPERTVKVTVPALEGTARPASVVDVQQFKDGDVALLGVTGLQAPMLTAASTLPESGASVVAAGFSGTVNQIVDANKAPTFSPGNVSGTQTVNGTPFTQISSRTSPGMSGGPVLDMKGNVVGTVSWAPSGANTSSDFMTSATSITSILSGNGVNTALSPADQAYRQGLADYYKGRYHAAVTSFDKALALQPAWKMVTEIKLKAVAKYPDEVIPAKKSSGSGLPMWAYLALAGGAVIVGGAGLGVFLIKRRGARPAPAGPPVAATAPAPPLVPAPATSAPPPMTAMPPPPPPAPAPAVARTTEPNVETAAPATGGHHDFCPNCGVKHAAGAHYCEECGQPLPAAMPTEHEVG